MLWDEHVVAHLDSSTDLLAIDRLLLHERTGGVALKSLDEAGRQVLAPGQVFATMDHIVDRVLGPAAKGPLSWCPRLIPDRPFAPHLLTSH